MNLSLVAHSTMNKVLQIKETFKIQQTVSICSGFYFISYILM